MSWSNCHWRVKYFIQSVFLVIMASAIVAQTPDASPTPSNVIGHSLKQQVITQRTFGNGARRILVIGGIHGDEPASAALAGALALAYEKTPPPAGLTVSIIAEANPDGLAANTRVNSRGVDINRNFPARSWQSKYREAHHFPGPHPKSEPETQALIAYLEQFKPDLILTLHAALGCINWDGPANDQAARLAELTAYPLCASLGYATPGSLGEYAGRDHEIPVITIELRSATSNEQTLALLPALLRFLN